jgi:hypothetical protein
MVSGLVIDGKGRALTGSAGVSPLRNQIWKRAVGGRYVPPDPNKKAVLPSEPMPSEISGNPEDDGV